MGRGRCPAQLGIRLDLQQVAAASGVGPLRRGPYSVMKGEAIMKHIFFGAGSLFLVLATLMWAMAPISRRSAVATVAAAAMLAGAAMPAAAMPLLT